MYFLYMKMNQTLTRNDQSEVGSCCWDFFSAEPPDFCGLEIMKFVLFLLVLVKADFSVFPLILKERRWLLLRLNILSESSQKGEGMHQTGLQCNIWLALYRIFLFASHFLPLVYVQQFSHTIQILHDFKSKRGFFLMSSCSTCLQGSVWTLRNFKISGDTKFLDKVTEMCVNTTGGKIQC